MGTRGVTIVIDRSNQIRVAQYGQWDHYPQGQGLNVLNFLRGEGNLDRLEANLDKCVWVTDEFVQECAKGYANHEGWMTLENAKAFGEAYPSLTRDTGSNILYLVADATGEIPLRNDATFANDDVFCEGVYTINLYTQTLIAVYHDTEREFDLGNLPTDAEFIAALETQDVIA